MENVYKYYEIASFKDAYRARIDTVSQAICYLTTGFELWSGCHSNSV